MTEVEQMINNAFSSLALRKLIFKGLQVIPATLLPFSVSNCWVLLNKEMLTASSLEKSAAFSWDVQRELWSAGVLGWGRAWLMGPALSRAGSIFKEAGTSCVWHGDSSWCLLTEITPADPQPQPLHYHVNSVQKVCAIIWDLDASTEGNKVGNQIPVLSRKCVVLSAGKSLPIS